MDYDPEPVVPFYLVNPEKELTGKPGRLIRDEALYGHAVPAAADRAYRVIYESSSGEGEVKDGVLAVSGSPIGVSGIVAFPLAGHPTAAGRS
jgi:hypothetical protein